MASLFRLVAFIGISGGLLLVIFELGGRAGILRSRPFVLLVVLPLILLFVWAVKKATRKGD